MSEPPPTPPTVMLESPPPAAKRARVWTVWLVFVLALVAGLKLAEFTFKPMYALWERWGEATRLPDGGFVPLTSRAYLLSVFLVLVSVQVGFAAVPLLASVLSPVPWRRRLRLTRPRVPWRAYPVLVLGEWAMGLAAWQVIQQLGLDDHGALAFFMSLATDVRAHGVAALLVAALALGLGPGFGEEILFRGYIQTRLTERWGRWASIILASVLFGAMHRDWVQGPYTVLMGVYLGWVSERAESIWPSILCHAAGNAGSVIVGTLLARHAPLPVSVAIGVGCTAALCLCVRYVKRLTTLLPPAAETAEGAIP